MISKTDLAYAAGIVDGEGHIAITKVKVKGVKYHTLMVCVSTTDDVLGPWMHNKFGGNFSIKKEKRKNHADLRTWAVATQEAENFLKQIAPWLKLKKPQAELALRFRTLKRNGSYRISKELLTARERCFQELQAMHR